MGAFSLNFARFKDKSEKQLDTIIRTTALELTSSIIIDTPVDTSRARSNWQVSIDKEINTAVIDLDYDGNIVINKARVELFSKPIGRYIFIQNNVDYITDLEYGTITTALETRKTIKGFSKQAPKGMARINILRFDKFLTEAVKETKNG